VGECAAPDYGEGVCKEIHFKETGYTARLPVRVSEKGSKETSLYFTFTNPVTSVKIALGLSPLSPENACRNFNGL
jgi:hypothetical protein